MTRLLTPTRLLLVAVAAIVGAALWRRREIRGNAERASKALADVAGSARSRLERGPQEEGGDDDEVEQPVAAEPAAASS